MMGGMDAPAKLPQRYLIYPANLNSHKNHFNLLIAFERWPQRSTIPLVLVGEGTELLHSDRCIIKRRIGRSVDLGALISLERTCAQTSTSSLGICL